MPSDRPVRRKYSNVLDGVGVVVLLVAVITGITVVQMRRLGWSQWPQSLERRLSESRVSPASPPPSDPSGLSPGAVSQAPQAAEAESSTPPAVPSQPVLTAAVTREADTAAGNGSTPPSVVKKSATVAQGPRFAVEFGPFLTGTEAERIERQINQAGYQTVRFRQQTGAALYSVLIERISGAREAQALAAALRDEGFPDPVVVGSGDAFNVRVGEPLLLRAVVQLAESLRAKGHAIRVAAQPGEAQTVLIRHGNFVSRDDAEARGGELERLGLSNYVVRAK